MNQLAGFDDEGRGRKRKEEDGRIRGNIMIYMGARGAIRTAASERCRSIAEINQTAQYLPVQVEDSL